MVVVAEDALGPELVGAAPGPRHADRGPGPGSVAGRLRRRLLDDGPPPATAADRRDRDRAAHLLLYLDRPATVLDLGLDHLVAELGTARGDAGLLAPEARTYRPTVVAAPGESADTTGEVVAAIAGQPLPNHHPVLRTAWRSSDPVAFDRVRGNPHLGSLEPVFTGLGTSAMLATRIEDHGMAVGLLCIDEVDGPRRWTSAEADRVARFVDRWLAPILTASVAETRRRSASTLTPAEREVVALLAGGRSYAEIAAELGKSVRTVDNQLRAARAKAGARNAVELVAWWREDGAG